MKYDGDLKTEQFEWLEEDTANADLVLVLGTTLGGLSADQIATRCAARSLRGKSLGFCLINLQQTEQDGKSSLRMFGKCDDVMEQLLSCLQIQDINVAPAVFNVNPKVVVPYTADGNKSESARMWWDLSAGARVRLVDGHNVQGSNQPDYRHIGAPPKRSANGVVKKWCQHTRAILIDIEGTQMELGQWWLEAAERGGLTTLPLVNINPKEA